MWRRSHLYKTCQQSGFVIPANPPTLHSAEKRIRKAKVRRERMRSDRWQPASFPSFDLLFQIFRRTADHQSAVENRKDHVHDHVHKPHTLRTQFKYRIASSGTMPQRVSVSCILLTVPVVTRWSLLKRADGRFRTGLPFLVEPIL